MYLGVLYYINNIIGILFTFVTIPITSSTVTPSLSSESPPLSILTKITTWVLQATPLLIIQCCSVDLYSSYTCVGLLYGLVTKVPFQSCFSAFSILIYLHVLPFAYSKRSCSQSHSTYAYLSREFQCLQSK